MSKLILDDFIPSCTKFNQTLGDTGRYQGDIFDLAHAFLNIESMTHQKLQKLCYYAKAWYLALNDSNLISESFEAWVRGAIQPNLYQEYKIYGFGYIPMYYNLNYTIPEEFLSFSREIFESYGELSGDELEKLNRTEEPWCNARIGLKPWQNSNNIINENDMKNYYRSIIENNE